MSRAGKRDLSAAVGQVHNKPKPSITIGTGPIDESLLLSPGDEAGRGTFFELDDGHKPVILMTKPVYVTMGKKASLPDYRTLDNQRTHRSMLTIPPKLRESLRELFGVETDDDYPITTAIIALADYGAMVLKREQKRLHVDGANDDRAQARKDARRQVRYRSTGRNA
jgi:hypothetical protein